MKIKIFLFILLVCLGGILFAQQVQSRPGFSQEQTENGFFLTIGSARFGPYQEMSGAPYFGPDGKSYILSVQKNKSENWILANGKEYGPFTADWMGDLKVSEDGSNWVAVFNAKKEKEAESIIVINGKEMTGVGRMERAEFPSPGFYYIVTQSKSDKGGQAWVLTPTSKYGPYDQVREVIVTDDKKGITFCYRSKGQEYLRFKDREYGPFDGSESIRLGNKRTIGFVLRGRANSTLVIGNLQLSYDMIESWYVSLDGFQWAVKARKGDKQILVINGKEATYNWVDWRNYDNGYMYVAQKEKDGPVTIVVNGRELGSFLNAHDFHITPGGSYGFVIEKKKGNSSYQAVIINGKEYEGESLRMIELTGGYLFTWLKYTDTAEVTVESLKVSQ